MPRKARIEALIALHHIDNRGTGTYCFNEACLTQQDTRRREKYLKTFHGKQFLHKRLKSYFSGFTQLNSSK